MESYTKTPSPKVRILASPSSVRHRFVVNVEHKLGHPTCPHGVKRLGKRQERVHKTVVHETQDPPS